ncbi:PREDICTED: indole glucosinolate O-methyltransferase 4-like [Camelina sativa]|uniref:Indole glucosinolate O-methyltransferase 4-like n=1 Tax=Camelina sativa TaxID=90675 RepID=A0ABM0TS26_CAMSA|nr:PREDICTED: indole glucosinolate O-methyltransferase 4-like [Camelina sativa]
MANGHLQEPLTTCLTKETQQFDEVGLQAERILYVMPFAMVFKAALELGVIDMIASVDEGVWLSSSAIVLGLPTKPTNPEAPVLLDRMLVLLASHEILKYHMVETGKNGRSEKMERVYAAEPVCKFFLNQGDGSGSFAPLFMLLQSELCFKTMTHLKDLILEGKDAFSSAHGMKLFEYIGSDERFSEMFNRGMSEASIMIVKKVLEVYRGFEDVTTLVDVGGGNGTNMSLITSKYPHIKGINFDLASALVHAPLYPGVENFPGDMFTEIPKGDAIFMKWILHDWTDEDCVKILKNCWRSLPEKGKVIIVEMITPKTPMSNDSYSNVVLAVDIVMLTHCSGGKERSLRQFESLAFQSGFLRCEVICLAYSYYVIEFHK